MDFPKYGYRRVNQQLLREELWINHKKIYRIMREKGWLCRLLKKKWICTTDSNQKFAVCDNLIKDLKVDGITQFWVIDITYIHILICFIYLSVILYVFSHKTIKYTISRRLYTQLILLVLGLLLELKPAARL
ncbi:MAG: IS3 family transposase [bacterium]